MPNVLVSGAFDDLRSRDVRFLEEASRHGDLWVWLWSDRAVRHATGRVPKFPEAERRYLIEAIRFVRGVILSSETADPETLSEWPGPTPDTWMIEATADSAAKRTLAGARGVALQALTPADLAGFPVPVPAPPAPGQKQVLVTGCYDWLHSGHVRFFEECAALGEVTVVVGHDANIRLLKGDPHPLFGQNERRYLVGAVRHVRQALISTGQGWLDAEPEIERLQPDIYAVNEDGDRPEKRDYCARHGIEYVVLKRTPKEGLPRRQSTVLRGF